MGLLDQILAADAAVQADADNGTESGIYTPLAGTPISPCYAFVHRAVPSGDESSSRGNHTDIVIEIAADGVKGPLTADTGGDTFTLPRKWGGTPEPLKVTKILEQGGGFWRLQLR